MIGRRHTPSTQEPDKPLGFDDYDLRLGDVMRGERATIGKSLLDVQRELKIKATYIAAIENCDVGAFETPGFVAGYVRSYARYLGMDPEWAYQRFCQEADFTVTHGMAPGVRRSAPEKRLPKRGTDSDPLASPGFIPKTDPWYGRIEPGAIGSVAVLVALIGTLGYGGWAVLQEVQRVQVAPVDEAPGVMAEIDPLSGAIAPLQADPPRDVAVAEAGDMFDRLYRPQALDVPVLTPRDGPIASIRPSAAGQQRIAEAESPAGPGALGDAQRDRIAALVAAGLGVEGAADPATPEETTEPRIQVVEAGPPKVEVLAVRPSWVRVRAADGTVLFEKILDAGERYEVPQMEEAPVLRAGNSGSVYFVVNGETFGPSAPGANIADNIALSPEALQQGFELADLSSDPDLARMVDLAEAAGN